MRTYRFIVTGFIQFPLDMLRYDSCWPDGQDDVATIQHTFDVEHRKIQHRGQKPFEVALSSCSPDPTKARWESFGWRVKL